MQKINTVWWRDDGTHKFKPEYYPGSEWVEWGGSFTTEKLNGTNVMVYFHEDYTFSVHKRRSPKKAEKLQDIQPCNVPTSMDDPVDKWIIEAAHNGIRKYFCNPSPRPLGIVYGEAIGPKIQGNPYGLDEHTWIPFIYDGPVPLIECPRNFEGMKDFLQNAESRMFPGHPMEGVVFRWAWGMAKAKGKDF